MNFFLLKSEDWTFFFFLFVFNSNKMFGLLIHHDGILLTNSFRLY